MQKTRIGISVGLLGAAVYFMGYFGGFYVAVLLAGYVLLFEENEWLRKSAVKALALMVLFGVVSEVIGLIPHAVDIVDDIVAIFGSRFYPTLISSIVGIARTVVSVIEMLLFIGLGFKAINQGTIAVAVVDNLIDKYMVQQEN